MKDSRSGAKYQNRAKREDRQGARKVRMRLKEILDNLGIEQKTFAKLIGFTPAEVNRWCNGPRAPSAFSFYRICRHLPNVNPMDFFAEEPPTRGPSGPSHRHKAA